MKPRLELDVDLRVEQAGRHLMVRGAGGILTLRIPTLASGLYLLRRLWPWRRMLPGGISIVLEWGKLRLPLRKG